MALQILDVTTKVFRSFYRKILPQSRNGRKLRMPLPEKVALNSSLDNISAISFLSHASGHSWSSSSPSHETRKRFMAESTGGKLPNYQNFSLNAADIIIGVGYDLMDLYELTNQALGGIILLQISSSWLLTIFHLAMFLSIFRPVIFNASVFTGKKFVF